MTATDTNLMTAYLRACQDHDRYFVYAKGAKKEGFVLISMVLEELGTQELVQAKRFAKLLPAGELQVSHGFSFAVPGSTLENLQAMAARERQEHAELYPVWEAAAREDKAQEAAAAFKLFGVAEARHEARLLKMAGLLESGRMFKRDEPVEWACLHCGYTHHGTEAMAKCPACMHPQAHFAATGEYV